MLLRLGLVLLAGSLAIVGCSSDESGTDDADIPDGAAALDGASGGDSAGDGSSTTTLDGASDAKPGDAAGDAAKDATGDSADASDAADASDGSDGSDAADAALPPDPPIDIYDQALVPKFELTFDAAAIAILSSTAAADEKTWVHGTFKYGGIVLNDVGVRRKGSSTFRALPKKAALKISFNKYVKGQKFAGLKDLTLNNMVTDGTMLTERLAYHVFRSMGLPAERANNAEVYINGANYGVYLNIETPNDDFLDRVFPGTANTLYEVNYGSTWLPGVENGFEVQEGDGTRADLKLLFNDVKNAQSATFLADIGGHLDTTEWLRHSATEGVIGHFDGYAYGVFGSHNYFMAGDVNGVFSLIPWSTDASFKDNGGTTLDVNDPKLVSGGQPTALGRCKASAPCWAAYKVQVADVLATYEALGLVAQAPAWQAQINALVQADPKKEYTNASVTTRLATMYAWLPARPAKVRAQMGIP